MHTQAEMHPDRTGIADYYSAFCSGNKLNTSPDAAAGPARDLRLPFIASWKTKSTAPVTRADAPLCRGITRVSVDEGEDVDARARAARIEHHRVEDVAGVGRPAEVREDVPGASGRVQQGVPHLDLEEARDGVQDQQESPAWQLHLQPGDRNKIGTI